MYRLYIAVLILIFVLSSVFAGEKSRVYFRNQDLRKYADPSDTENSDDPAPTGIPPDFKESPPDEKPDEKKLKRYVIPYEVSEGTEMMIIVPVTFNNRVTEKMLLDTGATGMHISFKLAQEMDILDSNQVSMISWVRGVGGVIPVILTIVDSIKVGEIEYNFIPTTISYSMSDDHEGLLGMDFMSNYSIQINTKELEVVFEELPESSEMPAGRTETWWRVTFRSFKAMRAAWKDYREKLHKDRRNSSTIENLRLFADRQYKKADSLCTKLNVYAGMHSVPLEWR